MAAVLPLSRYRPSAAAPLIIFVDLQNEFVFEGRPLQIKSAESALANCRRLLEGARAARLSIAHVRLVGSAFHHASHGAEWIDEFRPYGSEMVFERETPSCYGSPAFCKMMDAGGGASAILAGLAGSTSCLATLIEAEQRHHKVCYAHDASSSNARSFEQEKTIHEAAVQIASQFVELVGTSEILDRLKPPSIN